MERERIQDVIENVSRRLHNKKDAVLNSVDLIEKVHGKVIGIVLNGVENKKNNYYYYGE